MAFFDDIDRNCKHYKEGWEDYHNGGLRRHYFDSDYVRRNYEAGWNEAEQSDKFWNKGLGKMISVTFRFGCFIVIMAIIIFVVWHFISASSFFSKPLQ